MRDGRFNPAGRLPYTWYRYTEQVTTNEMIICLTQLLIYCLLSKPVTGIYKTMGDELDLIENLLVFLKYISSKSIWPEKLKIRWKHPQVVGIKV